MWVPAGQRRWWRGINDSPFPSNIAIEFLNFQLKFLYYLLQLEFQFLSD